MRLNYKWMIVFHGIITSFVSSMFYSLQYPNEISRFFLMGTFIILTSTIGWLQFAYKQVEKPIDKLIVVVAVVSPMIIGYLGSMVFQSWSRPTLYSVIISAVLTTALMSLLVLTEKMD